MTAVTVCSDFWAQEYKGCHCFHFSPSICHEVMELDAMIFVFWMLSFKPAFSLSSFTFSGCHRMVADSHLLTVYSCGLSSVHVWRASYLIPPPLLFKKYLFIWLHWVLVGAFGIFSWSMWDLVPWPGIEPGPPALGAWSLSHWTSREVPTDIL